MSRTEHGGVEIMFGCGQTYSGAERREILKKKRVRRRELKKRDKQNITFHIFMAAGL